MKVYVPSENVLSAQMQDEMVLLHLGTKDYYQLNATAACIWKGIEGGLSPDGLVLRLCSEFEVSPEQATAAVAGVIEMLRTRELIVVENGVADGKAP